MTTVIKQYALGVPINHVTRMRGIHAEALLQRVTAR